MSSTDDIREALRRAGITSRQVTVRGGSVTIHDVDLSLARVRELAAVPPRIELRYDPEVLRPVADTVAALISEAEAGELAELAGGYTAIRNAREVHVNGPGLPDRMCAGIWRAAEAIATAYLDIRAQRIAAAAMAAS